MLEKHLFGNARVVGDDVNTDYIISSSRKRATLDESQLARYLFETLDPGFAASVRPGDLLVAGHNFGCGSAMEVAATVILRAGIRAVLASSFARAFYRNAVNNGLLPIECDTRQIAEGDALAITLGDDQIEVTCEARLIRLAARPIAPFMREILDAGGLVEFVRHGGLRSARGA